MFHGSSVHELSNLCDRDLIQRASLSERFSIWAQGEVSVHADIDKSP